MKTIYLLVILQMCFVELTSQNTYLAPEGYSEVQFYSLKAKGILVSSQPDKAKGKFKEINYSFLDENLNESWSCKIELPKNAMGYGDVTYLYEDEFYILYSTSKNLLLYCVSLSEHNIKKIELERISKKNPEQIVVTGNVLYVKSESNCHSYDLVKKVFKEIVLNVSSGDFYVENISSIENQTKTVLIGKVIEKKEAELCAYLLNSEGNLEFKYVLSIPELYQADQMSCTSLKDGSLVFSGEGSIDRKKVIFIKKFKDQELIFETFYFKSEILEPLKGKLQSQHFRFLIHPVESTSNGYVIAMELFDLTSSEYSYFYYTDFLVLIFNDKGKFERSSYIKYDKTNGYSDIKPFITMNRNMDNSISFYRNTGSGNIEEYSFSKGELSIETKDTPLASCPEMKNPETNTVHLYNNVFLVYMSEKGKTNAYLPSNDKVREYCIQTVIP